MLESIDRMRRKVAYPTTTEELWSMLDAIEREVESNYIELPKDANGEPILVGDVMYPPKGCDDYMPLQVVRLTYDGYEDEWFFDGEAGGFCGMVGTHMDVAGWTHHKPPTVEDVLEKALNKAACLDHEEGYWPSAADITNLVNEIAPKLQLREAE